MAENKRISVAIITFNAERKIKECLDSVKWADEVVIVDSGSSDNTVAIAREYTDKIFTRQFDNFSNQKNFAISKTNNKWVLSIDADEIVTEELVNELQTFDDDGRIDGYHIERLNNIYGRFVMYDRPDWQLRFFRKGTGEFIQPVHERIFISKDRVSAFKGKLLHYTMENISHHLGKLEEFTEYDVNYYPVEEIGFFWIIKNLYLRPFLKFIQHYFCKKAYKDGVLGYIFTVNTVMGEFITSAKHWERNLRKRT